MLLKIREKSQGLFAWVILIMICVPFALWGIQNYTDGGSETPIVTVGDKEFFQNDLNRAYSQFAQNLGNTNFDEEIVKQQAQEKLIRDEVLLQHVQGKGMVVSDNTAREFIKSLEYFQSEGKFDKKQYKALLGSQRITPAEFIGRIKKALLMEQYQKAVTESSFVTQSDIDRFFAIQNQKRDVEYINIPLATITEQPTDDEIQGYYQSHQDSYQTEEQISIEYIEVSLDKLAADIETSEDQLKEYYEEQKDLYTTKERRKISHILFSFSKDSADDNKALERAIQAKKQLADKDFATLAAEVSDDTLTAKKGGDLGLFNVGVMEKAFEDSAASLKLGEVSEPVKSAFGYHLIKVTDLVAEKIKPYEKVKDEISIAYKKKQAESSFYELGETLTDVSYENPDSLLAVSDALGIEINKTELFSRTKAVGDGIVSQETIRNAAFSEDVMKGNNSEPVEIGSDRLVVLRMLEHKPAEKKLLKEVKSAIIKALQAEKAKQQTADKATAIKTALSEGLTSVDVAKKYQLKEAKVTGLTRSSSDLSPPIVQAIFKAAKPLSGKPTIISAVDLNGSHTVISLLKVTDGVMSESDKQKQQLAEKNIANAYGQASYGAVLSGLQSKADISTRAK